MSDQGFHEIQLNGKQLVFLFMAAVVVSVAIFLLGVDVGRRAQLPAGAGGDVKTASTGNDSVTPPPATQTQPGDLSYYDQLQAGKPAPAGSAAPKAEAPPVTPPEAPPVVGDVPPPSAGKTPPASTPPASTPAKTPSPAPGKAVTPSKTTPAPPPSATPPATKTTPPPAKAATGQWYVVTDAVSTKAGADARVAQFKALGFDASIFEAASAPRYRVSVGPFALYVDAAAMQARLQKAVKGLQPSIVKR